MLNRADFCNFHCNAQRSTKYLARWKLIEVRGQRHFYVVVGFGIWKAYWKHLLHSDLTRAHGKPCVHAQTIDLA